jgi:hypothetical protein
MPKYIQWIGRTVLVVAILYLIIQAAGVLVFGPTWTQHYTKKDLIANYENRKSAILAVKDYFEAIVPSDKRVCIEFEDSHTLNRLDFSSVDSATKRGIGPSFTQWNLSTTSPQVDSILSALHWTQDTLTHLKHKLDLAFCISICNGEPCDIGFQRSGTGMYDYQIFSKPIPDSLKAAYNNGCTDIIYNPTVVLEYGGPAFGSLCFPKD